jgi:hypothetical protein
LDTEIVYFAGARKRRRRGVPVQHCGKKSRSTGLYHGVFRYQGQQRPEKPTFEGWKPLRNFHIRNKKRHGRAGTFLAFEKIRKREERL